MLKSHTTYFLLFSSLALHLLLAACRKATAPYPYTIRQAERLMNHSPDSARKILTAFQDSLGGLPEETVMYYRLLTVKANDKSYIPHTSDSLITRITRYYEKNTDRDKLMEAYYYRGKVYCDLNDALHALEYFQKAMDVSEGTERYDILFPLYENAGILLTYQHAYEEATPIFQKLSRYAILAKDSSRLYAPFRDMARVYSMTGKTDSALIYYQKAYQLAKEANNEPEASGVLVEQSGIYMDLKLYEKALSCLRLSLEDSVGRDMKYTYSALGDYFFLINEWDSSSYYYKKGVNSNNLYVQEAAYRHLTLIEKQKADHPEAASYFKGWLHIRDSLRRITPTESVCKAQASYNYQKMNVENQQLILEHTQKKVFIAKILLASLLLFSGLCFFIQRIRAKKETSLRGEKILHEKTEMQYKQSLASIKRNKMEIENLSTRLQQAQNEKKEAWEELLRNQKELLEITNQQILAHHKNKELQQKKLICSDIYVKFHEACHNDTILIDEEDWLTLQKKLDREYDNFTVRLYEIYPPLSRLELRMCCLLKLSFSVTQIAFLLGRSKSSISSSRTRLYKKLFTTNGKPEDLDVFIANL